MRKILFGLLLILAYAGGVLTGRCGGSSRADNSVPVPATNDPGNRSWEDTGEEDVGAAGTTQEEEVPDDPDYGIEPRRHDYGETMEGEMRVHTFTLRRPEGQALKLGRVYSPCPCLYVTPKSKNVAAGDSGEIEVKIHTRTLIGKKSFPLYVQVLEPVKKTLRADVTVRVSRVAADVCLRPEAFFLGTVRGPAEASVRLYNLTTRPLAVDNVTCDLPNVNVHATEDGRIAPGGFVTIWLRVREGVFRKGPIRGRVTLDATALNNAHMIIPVEGTSLGSKR